MSATLWKSKECLGQFEHLSEMYQIISKMDWIIKLVVYEIYLHPFRFGKIVVKSWEKVESNLKVYNNF